MPTPNLNAKMDRSLLILTALASGPKHGYALMQDIADFSGIRIGPGTLYNSLSKLEARGLIQALDPDDRRRPYRITPKGIAELRDQLSESARLAQFGLRRLRASR